MSYVLTRLYVDGTVYVDKSFGPFATKSKALADGFRRFGPKSDLYPGDNGLWFDKGSGEAVFAVTELLPPDAPLEDDEEDE